jgi:hypothetical protein
MRIIVYGNLHHKNRNGLELVNKEIPVIFLNSLEGVEKYDDGETILLITNDIYTVNFSKVIYGPQIDFMKVIEICKNNKQNFKVNMLSDWNAKLAKKFCNDTNVDFITIPFPVDVEKFKPDIKFNYCFIYFKHSEDYKLEIAKNLIKDKEFEYKIFSYGSYKEEEYLNFIKHCKFGIWVGSHESQGFALQEALSCDCPLFVLDVKSLKDENLNGFYPWRNSKISQDDLEATTAPYWDDRCGIINKDYYDIEKIFKDFLEKINLYKPRQYLMENLNYNIFINKLIEVFNTFDVISKSLNHICYYNKKLNIYKLKTIHNAGFFSCCSKRLDEIINHFNYYKKLPEILDSSLQFELFKPKSYKDDISKAYFEEDNNILINFENTIDFNCEKQQFVNYKNLDFKKVYSFIKKYFKPSENINLLIKNIEEKYHLNYEKICVLFFRGNDKVTETQLPSYEDYIKLGKKILDNQNDIKFLIQSDETEFINKMKQEFSENIIFEDEIRHISKNNNLSVDKVNQDQNYEFSKKFLAITIIISKCKYLICNSGNCSLWVYFYRNNTENSFLFVKNNWV